MKKKVIKFNENDIENLVKRIIKEDHEDYVSQDPNQTELPFEYDETDEYDEQKIYNYIYDKLSPVLDDIIEKVRNNEFPPDFDVFEMITDVVEQYGDDDFDTEEYNDDEDSKGKWLKDRFGE